MGIINDFLIHIFSQFSGYYFTGDGVNRDKDGYYWITGRVDDVLNVSGHRLGTAEIEGAIGAHNNVAEAAVVGFPHDIKGQGIYAYVTLMTGIDESEEIKDITYDENGSPKIDNNKHISISHSKNLSCVIFGNSPPRV